MSNSLPSAFQPFAHAPTEFQEEQEQRRELVDDILWQEKLRPWCRVCKRPVRSFGFDHYAGNFWGFWAYCHGALMGGLVRELSANGSTRLEVFAFDDPHMLEGPWWWVTLNGEMVQDSRAFHASTMGASFITNNANWVKRHPVLLFLITGVIFNPMALKYLIAFALTLWSWLQ